MNVLFLATNIFATEGGAERFNRRVTQALAEFKGAGLLTHATVIALWDGEGHKSHVPDIVQFIPGRASKIRTFLTFLHQLTSRRPNIVLFGHLELALLAPLVRIIVPQSTQILFVHGAEVWTLPRRFRWWIPGLVLRSVISSTIDTVVAVSTFTVQKMKKAYDLPTKSFRVLANAVDPLTDNTLESKTHMPLEGKWKLLTVSRLDKLNDYKNVDKVILALPRIIESFPDTHYYIVGVGDWRPALEALARQVNVAPRVHFLGSVPDNVRDALYANADVFVLPSTGEGFGIAFIEAWRYGLAVVASDRDAASEVIENGVDGLCVPPSPGHVAQAVIQMLSDDRGRKAMGIAGRRKVAERYSHNQFRGTLRAILEL